VFWEKDWGRILGIPIKAGMDDLLAWHYDKKASSLSSPVTMFWLMTKRGWLVTSRERAAQVLAELQNLASAGKRYGN